MRDARPRPRRHRLQAQGLKLSLRPLARLAEDEKPSGSGGEARRRRRLGQKRAEMTTTRITLSQLGHANGRTCSLADPRSVVHLALKCSDIFEHVGLQTLLDDPALLQIAQDATDVLARHPGHGSQVLPADPLVEQNASTTRVLAD